MKDIFNGFSLVLLGTVLSVGCGGVEREPTQDAPAPGSAGEPVGGPQESSLDDSQLPGAELVAPGSVNTLTACCFARCSDRAEWHGPFKSITPGNCANYANYWCKNHHWAYVSAKWDQC